MTKKLLLAVAAIGFLLVAGRVDAAPLPGARVSLTFDDGYSSVYDYALPIMHESDLSGVSFVVTGDIGSDGYLDWEQLLQLQNNYGWEVGSHSVSHPLLSELSEGSIEEELSNSFTALSSHGLDVYSFATPYGDYSLPVLELAARYYGVHRGFWDRWENSWPQNRYLLSIKSVEATTSPSQVSLWLQETEENSAWLILVFHELVDADPSMVEDFDYSIAYFREIIQLIVDSEVPVTTLKGGFDDDRINLIPNGDFSQPLIDSWTTDQPLLAVRDQENKGAYPEAEHSLKIVSTGQPVHVFSQPWPVAFDQEFTISSYLNTRGYVQGEIGFYIDEYNAIGDWVSGQWLGAQTSAFVEELLYYYRPTSSQVRTAALQVYVDPGSELLAYLDNVRCQPLGEYTPPVIENLVDPDWDQGWQMLGDNLTRQVLADGSAVVSWTPADSSTHLVSDLVEVSSGSVYYWSTQLTVSGDTGEFGYYIDEYNADGDWISGQWLDLEPGQGELERVFVYTPSSDQVVSAGLQYYRLGGGDISVTLHKVELYV